MRSNPNGQDSNLFNTAKLTLFYLQRQEGSQAKEISSNCSEDFDGIEGDLTLMSLITTKRILIDSKRQEVEPDNLCLSQSPMITSVKEILLKVKDSVLSNMTKSTLLDSPSQAS